MTEGGRRGLAIALWALLGCLFLYGVQDAAGLKYVQGVIWPTDIYTFQRAIDGPIDVAVVGSSRASFAVSPSRMDACLAERGVAGTQTVSLARTFATAKTADQLRRDLLAGERTPQVLVLAVGPEFFNEHNHQSHESTAANTDLSGIPAALGQARGLQSALAALRPLTRGVENIAIFLTRRHETEDHLRWMMLHHGGGQFCYDSEACSDSNKAIRTTMRSRWDLVQRNLIPQVGEERFARYAVGDGRVHDALRETLRWAKANDVEVVLAHVPLHTTFQAQIPPAVRKRLGAYLADLAPRYDVTRFTPSSSRWPTTRSLYTDADHLSAIGSRRFTDELCKEVIAPMLSGDGG